MNPLIIANVTIGQDNNGMFSLNDLHKASGGDQKHRPKYWLENKQTAELISEIEKGGIPPYTVIGGRNGGTYVCKAMVYAYAMWVSPKFHLEVISTYDAVKNGSSPYLQKPSVNDIIERRLNAELAVFRTASAELRMSDASKVRGLADICRAYGGDPTHFLPAYVGDPFARCITDLLKEHQSDLTTQVANQALINLGLLEEKERRGKGGTKVSFKCLTQAGLEYGRNETSVQQPRQTQPLYYPDKFAELLEKIDSYITYAVCRRHEKRLADSSRLTE